MMIHFGNEKTAFFLHIIQRLEKSLAYRKPSVRYGTGSGD